MSRNIFCDTGLPMSVIHDEKLTRSAILTLDLALTGLYGLGTRLRGADLDYALWSPDILPGGCCLQDEYFDEEDGEQTFSARQHVVPREVK